MVYEDLQSINTNLTSYRLEMGRFLDRAVVLEVYEDLHQPAKRTDMLREGKRTLGFVYEVYEVYVLCAMRKQVPGQLFLRMGRLWAEKLELGVRLKDGEYIKPSKKQQC